MLVEEKLTRFDDLVRAAYHRIDELPEGSEGFIVETWSVHERKFVTQCGLTSGSESCGTGSGST